jgi:hypothetical protein
VWTFAIDRLFLGDTDRLGQVSNQAWQQFGYDIDGRITTVDSTDVCKSGYFRAGVDGNLGIDNAWGRSLLFVVSAGLASTQASDDVTRRIASGDWTLLVQIAGLNGDPKQSATGLDAQVFVGASTGATTPTFDTFTDWPVAPSSLDDGATLASRARVHFDDVFVTNGVIVASNANAPLTIPLVVLIHDTSDPTTTRPASLTLRVSHPLITLSTTGAEGVISGVIADADARAAANELNRQLDANDCIDAFALIAGSEDIMADGTNMAGVDCNAFSIGLGFDSKRVANPTTVGRDPAPFVDPCDAGTD